MKAFHLKDVRTFLPPYKENLEYMLTITKERSVTFHNGVRGFIVGNFVLAPFHQSESCIVKKDGHDLVLTYNTTNNWGVSIFLLPFTIPCEPLHYRNKKIDRDTFLFRVFNHITLCSAFAVRNQAGEFGMDAPDQFCPVFDRHGHLIGITNGVFNGKPLCVPIKFLV